MPRVITLPAGPRLLVEELPHTYSVAIGYFIGVGASYEPAPLSGAAHFIEHMCFKGTRELPNAMLISDAIEGVGGILNAATSYESTVYWAKVADMHFDRAVHVLTEMLCCPLFDPREVEKERRVIIEEIRSSQDSPGEWVHALLQAAMWGSQPLGRDIAGSPESISALSRDDLLTFWHKHYRPENLVISVAGNVRTDQVVATLETAFAQNGISAANSKLPEPADPTAIQRLPDVHDIHPALPGPRVTLLYRQTEQSNFCLGVPSLSYRDSRRRALQVLDTIVGGGMASRLFQILREELGLAYHIESYQSELAEAGMWVIYGGVEPDMLRESISTILDILCDILNNGVTEEEVIRVKEQVKGGILLSLEDTWSVASRNGAHQLRYNEVIPVERVVAEVEAITEADILQVARRVLQRDALHLAVIGPYGNADQPELDALLATAFA